MFSLIIEIFQKVGLNPIYTRDVQICTQLFSQSQTKKQKQLNKHN